MNACRAFESAGKGDGEEEANAVNLRFTMPLPLATNYVYKSYFGMQTKRQEGYLFSVFHTKIQAIFAPLTQLIIC